MLALGSIVFKHSASTFCHSLFFSLFFSPPCPAMPFALSLQHQGPQHVSADECAWGHFQKSLLLITGCVFEELFSVFCFLCNVSLWMFVSLLQRAVKMRSQAGRRTEQGGRAELQDKQRDSLLSFLLKNQRAS